MARGTAGEETLEPEVSPEEFPRKLTPQMRESSLGRSVAIAGTEISQKYAADASTYAGNQLADLRIKMTQAMKDAQTNAQPGADGFTQGILKTFDTQAATYAQDKTSPFIAKAMAPGLQRMRSQFADEAINYEAQAGVLYRTQSSKDTVDKLASIVATHPEQAQELTGQALSQINSSRLGPDVTLQVARYAQSAIAKSAVQTRIQQDPYGTMSQLLKPETADPTIQALRPEERETLLNHADAMLHQRVADAQRIDAIQEKTEREGATSALSSLIKRSQSPQGITAADVDRVAPLFRHEPGLLENAYRLASGGETKTDVSGFIPRFAQAQQGVDQTEWVMAHVGHDLSEPDAEKLLTLSNASLPNAHKEGAATIDGLFKQGLMDKYDEAFNARHMNALNDYYSWARKNPDATPAQAVNEANQISRSYSQSYFTEFQQKTSLPMFAVGGKYMFNRDATEGAIAQAEKAGHISHAEAVKQMALAEQWGSAMDRMKGIPSGGAQ